MTKFTQLPPLGSTVLLGSRSEDIPTEAFMAGMLEEAKQFYPWYRLCPIKDDVITVDTRPEEKFLVSIAGQARAYRDRWICQVNQITSVKNRILILGRYFQWSIVLPGYHGVIPDDECTIAQVEIIGQAEGVYRMK